MPGKPEYKVKVKVIVMKVKVYKNMKKYIEANLALGRIAVANSDPILAEVTETTYRESGKVLMPSATLHVNDVVHYLQMLHEQKYELLASSRNIENGTEMLSYKSPNGFRLEITIQY